jgi:dihydroorotase
MGGYQVRTIDAVTSCDTWEVDLPHTATPASDSPYLVLGNCLIDMYSSSGEPGYESRETIDTMARSALGGGFARVGILPNTDPPTDNCTSAQFWRQLGNPFLPWGAITRGLKGEEMTDLAELAEVVVGFGDGQPIDNLALVRRVLEYVQPFGKPVLLFAQNRPLRAKGVMHEGKWSALYGMEGIPAVAETAQLAALLELVRYTQTPTHFMRISTGRSIQLIAQAKADDLPVTASVTWMHLCFSDRDLSSYSPHLKLNPPLASDADRHALITGIKTGVIDAIAIDHTPYTYEEKMVAFESAPSGCIGLEFALPVLWQELVETGLLSALELWRALSVGPARCLGIDLPNTKIWFDPHAVHTPSASLSRNSPFYGKPLRGKVLHTSLLPGP